MPRGLRPTNELWSRLWALVVVLVAAVGCAADDEPADPKTGWPADLQIDWQDYSCKGEVLALPECSSPTAVVTNVAASLPASHIPQATKISYTDAPPLSGPHRGVWAKWGRYAYLPPQRWIHNMEHGGVAFLYDPCAPPELLAEIQAYIAQQTKKDRFWKYVLTPYPGLPTAWAVAAWEWKVEGECFAPDAVDAFLTARYDNGPEVGVNMSGDYDWLWEGF